MEKYEFMPSRQKLWDELSALATVEIMTDRQREDENNKSRLFWELEPIEHRLKNPVCPWLNDGLSPIQRRIIESVCKNF